MTSDITLDISPDKPQLEAQSPPRPRVWPAVALVALFWTYDLFLRWLEVGMFVRFMSMLAATALLVVLFAVWWLLNRRIPRADRWACMGVAVGSGVVSVLLSHKVGLMAWLLIFVPWLVTAWAAWLLIAWKASARVRRLGVMTAIILIWSGIPLLRYERLSGDGMFVLHWRWTPLAEDLYLAQLERRQGEKAKVPPIAELIARPGDWTGFRGPQRDSVVRSLTIAADWNNAPPRLLWRQRIGPGWSSMAVVGDRLFTQEQRGPSEVVVCLDAATGQQAWVHEIPVRHDDDQAGPGPRATPTFADGRLYTLGGTGILSCLDAVTGKQKWSHDVVREQGAKKPIWGFSCSPLIVRGLVVVFAEGDGEKTLLAYRASSGELAWTADAGKASYGSPQRMSVDDAEQIVFLGARGVIGIDPASGKELWVQGLSGSGMPRSLQPHPLDNGRILFASENDGLSLLQVKREGKDWTVSRQWTSRAFKPTFNDFVIHDDSIYGFDGGGDFCCLDARTGQRRWKAGHYGHGQVLLLAEPAQLLVISEEGQVILLKANPQQREEIGQFQAIKGTTWNHPAIAQGRLYVRNSEEIACYELTKR